MKSNEQIFAEIREQGYITEQQMKLLKNRSNREGRDLFDYSLKEKNDGVPVTATQGAVGLAYLRKQAKIYNTPLGWREKNIIEHATENDFRFMGFRNCAYDGEPLNLQPVFRVNTSEGSMEYYVSHEVQVTN
jgi:hypothetical protein